MSQKITNEEQLNTFVVTKTKLLKRIDFDQGSLKSKITIVGFSAIGTSCAMCLLMDDCVRNIMYIDPNKDYLRKIKAKLCDLQHAAYFSKSVTINGGVDFALSSNSTLCIITVDAIDTSKNPTILTKAQANTALLLDIIPNLVKYSPNTLILVITEPNNIMTYVVWRLSKLEKNRVFGLGNTDESSKFRAIIAEKIGCSAHSVHGWIIGDRCISGGIPIWTSVGLAGASLIDIFPYMGSKNDTKEKWYLIPDQIIKQNVEIQRYKGKSNWGIAFTCARICRIILKNSLDVLTISCHATDYLGIEQNVFLALPCMLGSQGVVSLLQEHISDEIKERLKKIAFDVFNIQINLTLVKSCET